MVKTASTMLPLGTRAPDFALPNVVTGETVKRSDAAGKPMLVMFICNHCPFVKHVRAEIARIGNEYQKKGVFVVGISSNDVTSHPEDAPDLMVAEAKSAGYEFPYLYDESQEVAKAYKAACTPDFFLFDQGHRLAYRGQLDGSRPGNDVPVNGRDLRAAIEAITSDKTMAAEQVPSIGCNIKWRPGNEPDYFAP